MTRPDPFYPLDAAVNLPAPMTAGGPPIFLGGQKRRGIALAGRAADGWLMPGDRAGDVEYLAGKREELSRALEAQGRSPDALIVAGQVVCGESEADRRRALDQARAMQLAGATHLVLDIPIGPTAKVRSMPDAQRLRRLFEYVARRMGLSLDVVITDGRQPVGQGVGPVLEARDVMRVLQNDPRAPDDLRQKALRLAGRLIECDPDVRGGDGYAIARGTDVRPLMAELCGKATGISRGKGGSMHFYDVPAGNFGGDGIVGGHLPIAAGMGYAIRLRQTDQVVVCFFGDGAVNEGAFHEALNVSALWGLPVVYVIENNRYGMGTSLDRASSVKDLYQRGSAYGIPRRDVDGMDLLTVRGALAEAIDRARREKRPTLLEVETYRYRGHSMSDPGKYRTKEEVDQIIQWLTGYDEAGLKRQLDEENDIETFFAQAPQFHPNSTLIKGVVCGVRVEEVEDPLMRKIRYLDKLIDELAKGKAMEKILRQ